MGILTDDMRRLVDDQKLAFRWDDDHLFFADICSPQRRHERRARG